MVITPNGHVRLLAVPFDISYKDTKSHSSIASQTAYFSSRVVGNFSSDDYTFVRKDQAIRVNANADQLTGVNYVMYQNTAFSQRWFYAFITRVEWLSDSSSNVYIETDVLQTWYFHMSLKPSFIIREHVADDTPGLHTVPENVELGEYRILSQQQAGLGDLSICLAVTVAGPNLDPVQGDVYGGIYSGSKLYAYPYDDDGISMVNAILSGLTEKAKEDAVVALYLCPSLLADYTFIAQPRSLMGKEITISAGSRPTSVDGYIPYNNKLLTNPYCFCYVHNNSGSAGVFPFELFSDATPTFTVVGSPTPSPTPKIYPNNYRGIAKNYDESLTISGYPLLSWNYDAYKGWVAQSGASTAIGTIGSLVALGTGIATGGTAAILGGIIGATASIARVYEASKQPAQSRGNALSGSTNASIRKNDFFIEYKSIRAEYARIIDGFFHMYGYKINRVKNIELATRLNWNYIQVNDLSITGQIPGDDLRKIKTIFQNGITYWHTSDIGNYNLPNDTL